MRIDKILRLVEDAAAGRDNIENGAVGSNGYGFVFRELDTDNPHITYLGSSKVFGAGAYRDVLENFKKRKLLNDPHELLAYDEKYDLLLFGAVKTLVPTLQFGGYELLFNAWMFVVTPEGRKFPAVFYRGQSGTSIGGWWLNSVDPITGRNDLTEELEVVVNFSPFDFTDDERNLFLDALQMALRKVPVSDYWGVFNYDLGNIEMGIKRGKPYMRELGFFPEDPMAEKSLTPWLGKPLKIKDNSTITVNLLPGRKIYIITFDYDKGFFSARETLDFIEDFTSQ